MSLAAFQSQGLLELLDVELARALDRASGEPTPDVELAIALTSRSIRRGHSCFPLELSPAELWPREATPPEPLPDPAGWKDTLRKSRLSQDGGPLVLDGAGRLYLRRYWQLEQDVAAQLAARASGSRPAGSARERVQSALERMFPGDGDSPQRRAAANALEHRVSLLCGGPGTGKTTTVAAIVALFIESAASDATAPLDVLLLAPTGKSAARLGEAVSKAKSRIDAPQAVLDQIPEQATTIHRALGMQRKGMRFRRSSELPLEADLVVVDEASMVDLALMRQLLDATPADATLLIVGDPDQLTSVEAGSVLRDLVIASETTWWRDRVTSLTETYRYDERQPLGRLVAAIRAGDSTAVDALLSDTSDDVVWAPLKALPSELDRAADHWSEVLSAGDPAKHFALRSRYVMLSPFRVGPIGTQQLGMDVSERLRGRALAEPRITPIIIEQNSQELGVFNGDFAMLVDGAPRHAVVQREAGDFPELAAARLPRHSEAFAISVHNSQGSEFDEVLVVVPKDDAPLLTRELLYTAVSRARQRVRLVGPREVVMAALRRKAERHSGLVDAIAEVDDVPARNEG